MADLEAKETIVPEQRIKTIPTRRYELFMGQGTAMVDKKKFLDFAKMTVPMGKTIRAVVTVEMTLIDMDIKTPLEDREEEL